MPGRWIVVVSLLILTGCQTLLAPVPPDTDVDVESDPVVLATACLDRGDDAGAVPHLLTVVRRNPDQLMFRAQLAELLHRVGRDREAADEFGRFVADAQGATGPAERHLVHCHTRLMEIAGAADDRGTELFHRGVGFLLLANGDADGAFTEDVVCRSVRALEEARELRPTDPRVSLYLGDAHAKAGHRRAAERAWAAARRATVPGALTSGEARRLAETGP